MGSFFRVIVGILIFPLGIYWLGKWAGRREVMRGMQDDPATAKQRAFIERLASEIPDMDEAPNVDTLTVGQASDLIDGLLLRKRRTK